MTGSRIIVRLLLHCVFLIVTPTLASSVRYVQPGEKFQPCPNQPCLTFNQYVEKMDVYFNNGATFLFLVGNHTLKSTVELVDVHNITFKGSKNDPVNIICTEEVIIACENVSLLTVEDLSFTFEAMDQQNKSALVIRSSHDIKINHSTFKGSSPGLARALLSFHSHITVINSVFEGNTGDDGGAMCIYSGSIILIDNSFYGNRALYNGGAIYANDSSITLGGNSGNYFVQNSAEIRGGGLILLYSNIVNNLSSENLLFYSQSNVDLYFSENTAQYGGGILMYKSYALLSKVVVFQKNSAKYVGGAMYINFSTLKLDADYFTFVDNKALNSPIGSAELSLEIDDSFLGCHDNRMERAPEYGGAINVNNSDLVLSGRIMFKLNMAHFGGAIFLSYSSAQISGSDINFVNNSAYSGGALTCINSQISLAKQVQFIDNTAVSIGGGIWSSDDTSLEIVSVSFVNNTAGLCGGAIFAHFGHMCLHSVTLLNNSGTALCSIRGNMSVSGVTRIAFNSGQHGGGIRSINSVLSLSGDICFENNSAEYGGAVYIFYSQVRFSSVTLFMYNHASKDGGALHAVGTQTTLKDVVSFTSNTARNGGAMYFQSGATLTLELGTNLTTTNNKATQYGGAVYHEDSITQLQCQYELTEETEYQDIIFFLPTCFLSMKDISKMNVANFSINSLYDSAGVAGSFLFGGLIDKCQINILGYQNELRYIILYPVFQYYNIFHLQTDTETSEIDSHPYKLCFCENSYTYNCSTVKNIEVYRGETFSVSLLALAQAETIIPANIIARNNPEARLKVDQISQSLHKNCTKLFYGVFSPEDHAELILYPDAPCRDTGLSRAQVNLTFLPCPDGFALQAAMCVCEERLHKYGAECTIGNPSYIVKKPGSEFWMKPLYEKSYEGLVLYHTCPFGYCTSNNSTTITFDNLDIQCALHRSGVLCGACATNYSLMLGSSQCEICSNDNLALLLAFAVAGIVLIIFLTFLRFTVATGMINCLILYVNIVQVNKSLFFSSQTRNVFTVFIAWMNLDLGLQTCFYDGLDAYAQTLLQFAFPVYVWILISLIILISKHSSTLSKLIGSNPVAVLATLLLMSYTKILKIVIEVYSSVDLDYPHNKTVTVWLKDANVPYLKSKHLYLTVATSAILVFLVLPYTLLLLLGYKFYRFTGTGHRWVNRIKTLLDSYYAPYNAHTRFWSGFLLLLRCALYIVFSYNSLGGATKSLFAIVVTFTLVGVASAYMGIYNSTAANVIEASIYFNLVVLSSSVLADISSPPLVYTLVGVVFVTMKGVILYHFHLGYIAQSAFWLKIQAKFLRKREAEEPLLNFSASHDLHTVVTRTVIGLREPILED